MRLAAQGLMPTNMSSEEIMQLAADLRERAFFSARTANEHYLETVKRSIEEIVSPHTVIRDGRPVTEGLDMATARLRLKETLEAIDYQPAIGKRGTIQDLSSDGRLNLVIRTNTEMAQGYANWRQTQDQDVLDAFPAQELFRAEEREVPRNWPSRWYDAGGQFYDGRMIAPKNDPIWVRISAFSLPYPPFDFNSGMDVQDVSREEALALGVIEEGQQIQPQKRPFEEAA